jgi:hypothetical protein
MKGSFYEQLTKRYMPVSGASMSIMSGAIGRPFQAPARARTLFRLINHGGLVIYEALSWIHVPGSEKMMIDGDRSYMARPPFSLRFSLVIGMLLSVACEMPISISRD